VVAAATATLVTAGLLVAPASSAVADATAPTIAALAVVDPVVAAGDPVAIRYRASDVGTGVLDVSASMTGPGGVTLALVSPGPGGWGAATGGPITAVVPRGAPAGTYRVTAVTVYDRAGNRTTYTPGAATAVPSAPVPALDLAAVVVRVGQPGTIDRDAPLLTSFAMDSSRDRRRGEFVTWSFRAADARSPIVDVRVFVRTPAGARVETHRGGGDLRSGRISLWLPPDVVTGAWRVDAVTLTDSSGNIRVYAPDGRGTQTGRATHRGPSFAGMGFTVGTGTPRPDRIRVFDTYPVPVVRARVATSPVAVGGRALVSGSVTFLGRPVPYPVLAVYRVSQGTRSFVGLVQGTRTGTFARRVGVAADARFPVLFLGSDRSVASAPSRLVSGPSVRVGVPQRLAVPSTSVRGAVGRRATLAVALTPARGGAVVTLRRWDGDSWNRVRSVRTRADGTAVLSVTVTAAPRSYRWTTAYDGTGLAARSRIVVVRPR
jgi:hypothetical protein